MLILYILYQLFANIQILKPCRDINQFYQEKYVQSSVLSQDRNTLESVCNTSALLLWFTGVCITSHRYNGVVIYWSLYHVTIVHRCCFFLEFVSSLNSTTVLWSTGVVYWGLYHVTIVHQRSG